MVEVGTSVLGNEFLDSPPNSEDIGFVHPDVRQENRLLHVRVQRLESALARVKASARTFRDERDRARKKLRDVSSDAVGDAVGCVRMSRQSTDEAKSSVPMPFGELSPPIPVCSEARLAGKIRLKRVAEVNDEATTQTDDAAESVDAEKWKSNWVSGSEISNLGVHNGKIAEHLAESMASDSGFAESLHGMSPCPSSASEHEQLIRTLELEVSKLRSQLTHSQTCNHILELSLMESRSIGDKLATVCAQLESNNTALMLKSEIDTNVETLAEGLIEMFGRIVEVKEAHDELEEIITASTMFRSFFNCDLISDDLSGAETTVTSDEGFASSTATNLAHHVVTNASRLTATDIVRMLRQRFCSLRDERNKVLGTVSAVDNAYFEWDRASSSCNNVATVGGVDGRVSYGAYRETSGVIRQRIDLENAVLLQEIAALKEERADLQAQLYLLEKDKGSVELVLNGKIAELHTVRIQLEHKQDDCHKLSVNADTLDIVTVVRNQMADLTDAVQTLTDNADMRCGHWERHVSDLKRANQTLVAAFDRAKRKQRERIRRIQEQTTVMRERYEAQIRLLKKELDKCSHQDSR